MFTLKETAALFASLYKSWDDSVYKDWIRKFNLNEKQKDTGAVKRDESEIFPGSCHVSSCGVFSYG